MLLASLLAAWAAAWLAWETAVHAVAFDGDFSDGPFQLFNVLRRIAGGQVWGRDFQAFTGIAANWAHLPIFFIAGGDFRASEISRFFTSGLCHALAAVALARAFAPVFPSRTHALQFGLLFFAAGAALYGRVFQPGASLLGVRTFFPLLLAAARSSPPRAPRKRRRAVLLVPRQKQERQIDRSDQDRLIEALAPIDEPVSLQRFAAEDGNRAADERAVHRRAQLVSVGEQQVAQEEEQDRARPPRQSTH